MAKLAIKHPAHYYFVLTGIVIFTLSAIGQGSSQKLNQVISIGVDKIRVDSLLEAFSSQVLVDFSFNSKKINPAKVILVRNKKQTLAAWLSVLQHDMNIQYTILGDHIILKDDPPLTHLKPVIKGTLPNHPVKQPGGDAAINKPVPLKSSGLIPKMQNRESKSSPVANENYINRADAEAVIDTVRTTNSPATTLVSIYDSARNKPFTMHDSAAAIIQESEAIKTHPASSKKRQNFFGAGKRTIVAIGAVISVPGSFSRGESSSALGFGFDIKAEKLFGKKISGTLGLGYNYFTGNYTYYNYIGTSPGYATGKNFANLPILAGIKYYFAGKLYISGEAGMLVKASSNTGSHLAISPAAGYLFPVADKAIDLGIRLIYVKPGFGTPESTSLQNGGYSFWSLRIAYVF